MKITKWAATLALCIGTTLSCLAQSPKMLSDKIGKTTEEMYILTTSWINAFNEQKMGKKKFAELTTPRAALQSFIEEQLKTYKDNPETGDGKALYKAITDLLQFEQRFVSNEFAGMEKLTESSTDQDVEAAFNNLKKEARKEQEYIQKLNVERKSFAQRNGFSLENSSSKDRKLTPPQQKGLVPPQPSSPTQQKSLNNTQPNKVSPATNNTSKPTKEEDEEEDDADAKVKSKPTSPTKDKSKVPTKKEDEEEE